MQYRHVLVVCSDANGLDFFSDIHVSNYTGELLKTRFSDKGFEPAYERMKSRGIDTMRACAAECQQEAQSRARVDQGEMRRGIVLVPTDTGASVIATDPKTIFHEKGTGRYTPGGRNTPWVYFDERRGEFYTTTGVPAQPMMGPGFDAGVSVFPREARKRGLR